ncbi:MAG: hypothetical protein ACRD2Z_15480 [Thermoanaerobaculia bacterium]
MTRRTSTHLLSIAVLVAVVLLAAAAVWPAWSSLASLGVAVLLLAPWALAVAVGIRAFLRCDLAQALLALAVILVALSAALL